MPSYKGTNLHGYKIVGWVLMNWEQVLEGGMSRCGTQIGIYCCVSIYKLFI